MSIIKLTDAQVVRVFELTTKIAAIQKTIPAPPAGFVKNETALLEIAKVLRSNLEQQESVLLELGALLRPEPEIVAVADFKGLTEALTDGTIPVPEI